MRPDSIPSAQEMRTLVPRAVKDPILLRRWFRGAVYYHARRGRPRSSGALLAEGLVWAGLVMGLMVRGSWIIGAIVAAVGIARLSHRTPAGLGLTDEEAAELAGSDVVKNTVLELRVTGEGNGGARV